MSTAVAMLASIMCLYFVRRSTIIIVIVIVIITTTTTIFISLFLYDSEYLFLSLSTEHDVFGCYVSLQFLD